MECTIYGDVSFVRVLFLPFPKLGWRYGYRFPLRRFFLRLARATGDGWRILCSLTLARLDATKTLSTCLLGLLTLLLACCSTSQRRFAIRFDSLAFSMGSFQVLVDRYIRDFEVSAMSFCSVLCCRILGCARSWVICT